MGAAVDAEMKGRLSVTLIAARNSGLPSATASGAAPGAPAASMATHNIQSAGPLTMEQREQLLTRNAGRARRPGAKMLQTQLPLAIVSKGRFDKSEPTIHKGEDLDIPTYVRRGVSLN
jgi:cell division protein FtsZ